MTWRVASLYIAAVIGAGFASGQEILQFFVRFGRGGILGVIVATIILSVGGGLMIEKCHEASCKNYQELLEKINHTIAPFFDLLYSLFLIIGIAIMMAGIDTLLFEFTALKGGMYLTAVMVLIPLGIGPKFTSQLTAIIVPIMTVMLIGITIATIAKGKIEIPTVNSDAAITYSLLYCGYNLGFSLAVFASISKIVTNRKACLRGGLIGGLIIGVLACLIVVAFFSVPGSIRVRALPLLKIAQAFGPCLAAIYTVIIWLAMYSTALANTLAVSTRITTWFRKPAFGCILILATALLTARLGFVALIRVTYPIFGVIGLYFVYKVLLLSN